MDDKLSDIPPETERMDEHTSSDESQKKKEHSYIPSSKMGALLGTSTWDTRHKLSTPSDSYDSSYQESDDASLPLCSSQCFTKG